SRRSARRPTGWPWSPRWGQTASCGCGLTGADDVRLLAVSDLGEPVEVSPLPAQVTDSAVAEELRRTLEPQTKQADVRRGGGMAIDLGRAGGAMQQGAVRLHHQVDAGLRPAQDVRRHLGLSLPAAQFGDVAGDLSRAGRALKQERTLAGGTADVNGCFRRLLRLFSCLLQQSRHVGP